MKHLINLGGWFTVESPLYTHTHKHTKTGNFSIPNPCTAETQNEFYGKGSLIPRDTLACGAFLRPLCPAQYHGSNEGCIKMGALGSLQGTGLQAPQM